MSRRLALCTALAIGLSAPAATAAGLIVFDPANHQQSLVAAAHALEQIRNQARQLELDALRLLRLEQNLVPLKASLTPELNRSLAALKAELNKGEALALAVREADSAYQRLYPSSPVANADSTAARARFEESYAAWQRAARLQSQIVAAAEASSASVTLALSRSDAAVGALQATQAGNELQALAVKLAIEMNTLVAAQARAETSEQSRRLLAEAEAKARFKAFLGSERAYTPR